MSDGTELNSSDGLEGYLSQQAEVPAQGVVGPDGAVVSHDLLTVDPHYAPQPPVAPAGVAPQVLPGLAPQYAPPVQPVPQPGISAEEYQRAVAYAEQQEQVNLALARQQIELQEAVFESKIAHLDPYDQQVARNQHYLEQFWEANQAQAERIAELEGGQEEREQQEAKEQTAFIRMVRAGIQPWHPQAKADILSAETPEQMNARIDLWKQVVGSQQQAVAAQQTRAQVAAGAYAGAPQRGAQRAAPQVKRGDIEGYLKNKPFIWGE